MVFGALRPFVNKLPGMLDRSSVLEHTKRMKQLSWKNKKTKTKPNVIKTVLRRLDLGDISSDTSHFRPVEVLWERQGDARKNVYTHPVERFLFSF